MSAYKEGDPTTLNRLYGRSQGKPLRASQQELIDKLLPQIAVPDEGPVTSQALFGFDRPLHFEIGFGGGEHMAERADLLPDHGFIGAELYRYLRSEAAAAVDLAPAFVHARRPEALASEADLMRDLRRAKRRVSLTLALHELATNAVKHGSLSTESGQVSLDIAILQAPARLRFVWQEIGGPKVTKSDRDSGSRIIQSLTRAVGGTLHYDWQPEGLIATAEFPVAALGEG